MLLKNREKNVWNFILSCANFTFCCIEFHHVHTVLIENPVRCNDAQKEFVLICHMFPSFQFHAGSIDDVLAKL